MSEVFNQLVDNTVKTGQGQITVMHVAGELATLEKVYANEATREGAYIIATDWIENGSPLRKAAAEKWAKDKKISVGDQPDPNATQPTPTDASNGNDAPDAAAGAAGAGSNKEGEPGHDPKATAENKMQQGKVKSGNFMSRLKHVVGGGMSAAPGGGKSSHDAAYESGFRDATREHASHAHRIGRSAARHAFRLGTETGHAMAIQHQARANQALAIPTQQNITHPRAVMKGDLEGLLTKVRDARNHDHGDDGKFVAATSAPMPPARKRPSWLRATGRGALEAAPGLALTIAGARRGLHGNYASYKNQAKQARVSNPGKAARRLTVASLGGSLGGPIGSFAATHLAGFWQPAQKADFAQFLAKGSLSAHDLQYAMASAERAKSATETSRLRIRAAQAARMKPPAAAPTAPPSFGQKFGTLSRSLGRAVVRNRRLVGAGGLIGGGVLLDRAFTGGGQSSQKADLENLLAKVRG